ncbi:MAG: AAA family ATPase [Deltaproteobacteria bacterium]|nr:AAA family ATPase [Deltaproteobacteria bacterium]
MIGRERELTLLTQLTHGVALIAGEPGIGKTRLLQSFAERSRTRVLWGRAWEAGGAPAFWPWIEVLRAVVQDRAALAALGRERLSVLAQLLPELGTQEALPPLDPAQARFRLFDAVLSLLTDAGPLAIVLDDLHAADAASLALLHFVARARSPRLLVIGAYRDVEARLSAEASELLAKIAREARYVPLARLDEREVGELTAGEDEQISAAVWQASEGNPLFALEMLRLLRTNRARGAALSGMPDTVRDVLKQRLDVVSAETRAFVVRASVLGRDVDLRLAGELFGDVQAALKEALAADLLFTREDGSATFSHVLLREAAYAELGDAEKRALHARCADVLWTRGAHPEAMHHAFLGGSSDVADKARQVAEEATRRLAFDEAAEMLERALPLAAGAEARCDMLLAAAHALSAAGYQGRSREKCLAALALAKELGDSDRVALATLAYGEMTNFAVVDQTLIAHPGHALALQAEGPLHARLLARLAAALQPADDFEQPLTLAREAIAASTRLSHPRTHLAVLLSATSAMSYFAAPDERIARNQELIALAESLGEPLRVARGWLRLAFDYVEHGDAAATDAAIAAYVDHAKRLQLPSLTWPGLLLRGMRAITLGRFSDAQALAEEARTIADKLDDPNAAFSLRMQRVGLAVQALRDDVLAAEAPDAIAMVERVADAVYAQAFAPVLRARIGQPAALPPLAKLTPRLSAAWIADASVELGQPAPIAHLLEPLLARNHVWGVFTMVCDAPIALSLARLTKRAEHYEQALKRADALGAAPWRARILLAYARDVGDKSRAARFTDEAHTIFERLGMGRSPLVMQRDGDLWTIKKGGDEARLKDSRGLQLLARLVEAPGVDHHVVDLMAPPGERGLRESSAALIDDVALARYKERLREIEAELDEAGDWNDAARAESLRAEQEALSEQLGHTYKGQSRKTASSADKARVNVRQRLMDAVSRIAELSPPLGEHLQRALRTGTYCRYSP